MRTAHVFFLAGSLAIAKGQGCSDPNGPAASTLLDCLESVNPSCAATATGLGCLCSIATVQLSCYSQACGAGYSDTEVATISSQSSEFCTAAASASTASISITPATTSTVGTGSIRTLTTPSPTATESTAKSTGQAASNFAQTSVGMPLAFVLGLFATFM